MEITHLSRLHVSPDPHGWRILHEGKDADSSHPVFEEREEAVRVALAHAEQMQPCAVLIHDENGTLEDERVLSSGPYGRDPSLDGGEPPVPQKRIPQQPARAREPAAPDMPRETPGRTAADIKKLTMDLQGFTTDELRAIPVVVTGEPLEQGATYMDLRHPERPVFKATGDMQAGEHNWLARKRDVPHPIWNRLLGLEDPERTQ